VEQIHNIFKLCGTPTGNYCNKSRVPETAMFRPQQEYRRCVAETFKDLPPSAVLLIDSLLSLEPEVRGTAASALRSHVSIANLSFFLSFFENHLFFLSMHEIIEICSCYPMFHIHIYIYFFFLQFFSTEPFSCDPSSLPKLPPSKEYDVRRRQEEARRYVVSPLSLPYVS
jgi:cyclin-dependent kinase 12/13